MHSLVQKTKKSCRSSTTNTCSYTMSSAEMEIEIHLHGSRPPRGPPKRRFRPSKRTQAKAREAAKQARNRRRVAEAGTSRVTDQKDSSTAHVAEEGPTNLPSRPSMPTPKRQQSLPNSPPAVPRPRASFRCSSPCLFIPRVARLDSFRSLGNESARQRLGGIARFR